MNPPISPQPPSSPSEQSLGGILKKARESAGLNLDTLCTEMKLNKNVLLDLEEGNYNKLPATPYIRAFLISLANRLKLDSKEIIKRFNAEVGDNPDNVQANNEMENITINTKTNRKTPIIIIGYPAPVSFA